MPHCFLSSGTLRLAVLLSCLSACLTSPGQLPVRHEISTTESGGRFLVDGVRETGWQSAKAGSHVSLLLDNKQVLSAGYVLAAPTGDSYRLLGSPNYRDWTLLAEGVAATDVDAGLIRDFEPALARYLRFVSDSPAAREWNLLAGTRREVEEQLALMQPVDWGDIRDPEVIRGMLDLAFSWQVGRQMARHNGVGWVNGAFHAGISALYRATGNAAYRQAIIDRGNLAGWTLFLRTSGKAFYHSDDHCIGQAWLELYMTEPEPRDIWIADVRQRLDLVMENPLPGREDMNWCDALFMSPPNYVRLAAVTGDDRYRRFIDTQWWDATDFLYDPEYGLFYRDRSYFPDREPNGEPVFWSRGNGWVIAGLVRMLQFIPEDWPTRGDYELLLEEMAGAIASIQGEDDGLWSSSLLYPEKYDFERETSGSAFFTYAMAWGVNEGILERGLYGPVIEKAWEGLSSMLTANGVLKYIQQIGAGPAPNDGELLNKDYGYGAFLLAGTEMMRYFTSHREGSRDRYWERTEGPLRPAATGAPDAWVRVDSFEQPFTWAVSKNVPFSQSLVRDPFDPGGNRVFSIHTGNKTPGEYRATTEIPAIPEGSRATVYQRFSYDDPEIDAVFGISDLPLVDAWGDYETGLRIHYEQTVMEARSGGQYVPIGSDFLQLETWYEAWTVVDNAADTYDVYIRGGSNYPQLTLLKSDIPFRNGTSSTIGSFAISFNSDYCEGTFHFDDLHVDPTGTNLSRPAGVRQPWYSPWSDSGRRPPSMVKATPVGNLWDDAFPWIYHWELGSWLHVLPEETYPHGYWTWSVARNSWLWLSSDWPGWVFEVESGLWENFRSGG